MHSEWCRGGERRAWWWGLDARTQKAKPQVHRLFNQAADGTAHQDPDPLITNHSPRPQPAFTTHRNNRAGDESDLMEPEQVPDFWNEASPAEPEPGGYGGYGGYSGRYGGANTAVAERQPSTTARLVPSEEPSRVLPAVAGAPRPNARSLLGAAPTNAPQSLAAGAATTQRAPTCPPCPACSNNADPARSLMLRHRGAAPTAPGVCYCRYDAPSARWALQESACRAALFAKCGGASSLLECTVLEAFYSSPAKKEAAAASGLSDQIAAFLLVDCPPAAPCSCAALSLDGRDGAAARGRCCEDLRAHCTVPFSGLDCEEVDAFCGAGAASGASALLRQFVAVKTHHTDCAAPQNAHAYSRLAAPGGGREREGGFEGASSGRLVLLVGVACLAVGAAVAGSVVLVQTSLARQHQQGRPLLASRW